MCWLNNLFRKKEGIIPDWITQTREQVAQEAAYYIRNSEEGIL